MGGWLPVPGLPCSTFKEQDAIVEAFNPAAVEYQKKRGWSRHQDRIPASHHAYFSSDTSNEHAEELIIFEPKIKAQKYLEMRARKANIVWTAIIVGAFYDWGEWFSLCSAIPFERRRCSCISDRRIDNQIGHAFEKEHFGLMAVNVMSPYSDLGTKRLAFR